MSYPYGAPGGYPPQGGGYPPQGGPGYPTGPGGIPDPYQQYPPQPYGAPGGYPPQPGGYPGYPAQPGGQYPPAQGGYPPQAGGYPPQAGGYPPQQGGYPPQAGGYPPQQGGYPPQAGGCPPQPGGYPPQQGGYPPQPGYPQTQPGWYPQAQPAGYSTAPGGYPPATGGGAPGGAGYATAAVTAAMMPPMPQGQGTVKPYPAFNVEEDCKILRKAMKGIGTDEKAIIDVLSGRSNDQRQKIKLMFKTMFGKDLLSELKSELSGHFEQTVLGLLSTPAEYDAEQLRAAMKGAGTNESCLIEILCTRTNGEIAGLKAAYKLKFSRDLEKDLASETSGHFKRLVIALSTGNRQEGVPVNPQKAKADAMELYQAGEKVLGTDESKFNQILCSQSFEQLRLVCAEYKNIAHKGLDQSIRGEMSGNLESGMVAIVKCVENKHAFFAERLYHSMKGAGTKDDTLVRIIVSRCEVDMVQIKQDFQRQFGQSLEAMIQSDTSGDYKRLLLALVTSR